MVDHSSALIASAPIRISTIRARDPGGDLLRADDGEVKLKTCCAHGDDLRLDFGPPRRAMAFCSTAPAHEAKGDAC